MTFGDYSTTLTEALATVRQRIKEIRSAAFRDGSTAALQRFKGSDALLAEIERDIAAEEARRY